MDCPVSFAGAAPGFVGLDQINCAIPSGISSSLIRAGRHYLGNDDQQHRDARYSVIS